MRLLVSVRSAVEAERALRGGADIVDAKEPEAGALGPVGPEVLAAIARVVRSPRRMSAALGDVTTREAVRAALGIVRVPVGFVKLGFRGLDDPARIATLLAEAVLGARELPGRPAVIAVAYADAGRAGTPAPGRFPALLDAAGADGLLVDTCFKDRGSLFQHQSVATLTEIAGQLAALESPLALGGSLAAEDLRLAAETGAAIVGVRGAACRGGRNGAVEAERVRVLAERLRHEAAQPHG